MRELFLMLLLIASCGGNPPPVADAFSPTPTVDIAIPVLDAAPVKQSWTEKKKFREYQICVFETGDTEFCQCMMDQIVARFSVEDWDKNASAILDGLIIDGTVEHCMPILASPDAGISIDDAMEK